MVPVLFRQLGIRGVVKELVDVVGHVCVFVYKEELVDDLRGHAAQLWI